MTKTITRKSFLKRSVGGAAGVAAAGIAAVPSTARGATAPNASFSSPYAPYLALSYPSSWFVYTALIPGVIMPYDLIVCNRQLKPLPDIEGIPNLNAVPSDATMLLIYHWDPVAVTTANVAASAIQLPEGVKPQFTQLGGGLVNWFGFRQFLANYIVVRGSNLYSLDVRIYIGPNAGSEWSDVQGIVESMQFPA